MTKTRQILQGQFPRSLALLCAVLVIGGCSAADPALVGKRSWDKPGPRETWATAAQDVAQASAVEPLRAGSAVVQASTGAEAQVAPLPSTPTTETSTTRSGSAHSLPNADVMAQTLAELQSLHTVSADEQQRLLDQLKGSDPATWPAVVRNYRESLTKRSAPPGTSEVQLASHHEPAANAGQPKPAEPTAAPAAVQAAAALAAPPGEAAQAAAPAPLAPVVEALTLKNLTFCTEVTSFGVYKPLEKREFAPGQEVLLYVEIDNFKSESREDGFHTALDSRYVLADPQGKQIAEHHFGVTDDLCRNQRRDFFIRYQFRLPTDIQPGTYTLQLTISDTLSGKSGQTPVPLVIK